MLNLPSTISEWLDALQAPERLRKHLQIVYAVATELVEAIQAEWPALRIDKKLVVQGAALHDIGKTKHPNELYASGNQHPEAGYQMLVEKGYPEALAQIARVHEDWNHSDRTLEELLVALSDTIWCGIRNNPLEELVIKQIADHTQTDFWEVYIKMDPLLSQIAQGADERLRYQDS